MENKCNNYSLSSQGVTESSCVNFFRKSYDAVNDGVRKATLQFQTDPMQFDFRCAKAVYLNSSIKKCFFQNVLLDINLRNKIKHLKSHGMDYYVLEGKAIICFKKMDKKGRVNGFYSQRFKALMKGESVHYSKKMLDNLAEMGIHKPLPIYFIGHILDQANRLVDVRLVHYNDSKIAYEVSLAELFRPNLFNLSENDKKANEIIVESKINRNKRKAQ